MIPGSLVIYCLRRFAFVLIVLIGAGCAGDESDSPDRLASSLAYDSLRGSAPYVQGASQIDSLFLAYDAAVREAVDTSGAARWVDSTLASMTLDEKIGQLFIVHLEEGSAVRAVRQSHVGGFLTPRLLGPRDVLRRVRSLQRLSDVPLFFAADYERGVGRFNNALTELPSNMAIGATRDTLFAAAAGRLSAIEARAIGVNLLLAPVVDVNNNPDNPIINIRSYGEDPELVGRMAAAFVHEAERHGVGTTLKHFPGHGDTSVDSHARMGTIEGDSTKLERVELRPYRIVLDGTPLPSAVMSAHLWIPELEPDPLPATFSRSILTGLLREGMAYRGMIITDDVRMGALQTVYAVSERILRPLEAGADIVLTPADLPGAVAIVRDAVRSGRLTPERIDASVRRILSAKAAAGLHRESAPDEGRLQELMERPRGGYIAQAIADRSITLLKTGSVLPLIPDSSRIALIHLTNYQGSESIAAAMDRLDRAFGIGESVRLDRDPTPPQTRDALAGTASADVVVLAVYLRLVAGRGQAGLFPLQAELVRRLVERDVPVVLVTFGNPYAASAFSEADAVVVTYDQSLETVHAAARVLRGEQPALGRLPITVAPFGFGSGMDQSD